MERNENSLVRHRGGGLPRFALGLGIIGIFAAPEPAAVTLTVTQHGPTPLPNCKELELGDTAEFCGYSIKITSVCSAEVRFELLDAP